MRGISRRLGALAVAQYRQAGDFRVRQQEQLRRAIRAAGEAMRWELLAGAEPAGTREIKADFRRLTQAGMRLLERDLEAEIAEKREEIRQLRKIVDALAKLASDDDAQFPAQVEYQYTARQGKDDLVTRTDELVLEDRGQAAKAAEQLEKRLDRLGVLRDEMIDKLKKRQRALADARLELPSFVRDADPLVDEVLATL